MAEETQNETPVTNAEVAAPAVQEKAAEVKTPEPEKVVAKAVAKAPAQPAPAVQKEPSFEDLIQKLKASGTVNQRSLITALEQYVDVLAPGKPIEGDQGARIQYGFWKTISNVLENAPADEFKLLWNILLGFFNAHKDGALHERYVFRFSEFWSQSEAELTAFQRLINLIKLTANPSTRAQSLKQVDLQRTLAEGLSETARQRVLMFYQ